MPQTRVVFYREDDGTVPLLAWLDGLPPKAQDKCRVKLERLADLGHELHRPEADYLRDGVYELRVRFQSVNYRMLYFFHGPVAAVVSHGLAKEKRVPAGEIERAVRHQAAFAADPAGHSYEEGA